MIWAIKEIISNILLIPRIRLWIQNAIAMNKLNWMPCINVPDYSWFRSTTQVVSAPNLDLYPAPEEPHFTTSIVTRAKFVWFLDKNKVPTITVQNTTVYTRYQYNDQHCLTFPEKRKFPQLTWPTVAILILSLLNCSKLQRIQTNYCLVGWT